MTDEPFDPLDYESLADSIALKMLDRPAYPLGALPRFPGEGVYAIYYSGDYPAYDLLAKHNIDEPSIPIYVGKAVGKGGRQGVDAIDPGTVLYSRLRGDHAKSINAAVNLELDDFQVRYMPVTHTFITLGERALIQRFAPVWNTLVDGFGNHAPGGKRGEGMRPRWDTLHPGRGWAANMPERPESVEAIEQDVIEYLRQRLEH